DHLLSDPEVLAGEVLFVVQRRHLHGHATYVDWFEHRIRMQVTELARVPTDVVELCDRSRGREFPGDRPPRLPSDHPEPPLQLEIVDLDHRAVDLELEVAATLLPRLALH